MSRVCLDSCGHNCRYWLHTHQYLTLVTSQLIKSQLYNAQKILHTYAAETVAGHDIAKIAGTNVGAICVSAIVLTGMTVTAFIHI